MLKKDSIHAIAKLLKLEPQDLEAKITSEGEEDITLPELKVFTNDEFDTRIKNEKSGSYNEGKDAGVEMLVKEKKKELGYDFEGKDFDSLLTYHAEKIKKESGKPNERVSELEKDIENLNKTHAEKLREQQEQLSSYQKKYNQSVITNQLLNIVPTETTIPKEDVITLFNANFQTEIGEDGKVVVKQNGETVKDPTTASQRELKDVFEEFITAKKYVKGTSGRGGDNEFGRNGIQTKSVSGFQEQWQKKNPDKDLNSPEFQDDYSAWRKENKEVTA